MLEERYTSSPVQTKDYLLVSCRYIELNPGYLALGENDTERRVRYRKFLLATIPDGEWSLIREAVQLRQLTGTDPSQKKLVPLLGDGLNGEDEGYS